MSGASALSILGGAFIAVLVAGYFGQRALPPPAPKLVGIDLGTTYSCIGSYQAVTGHITIYEDLDKHKCIPSVVAFSGDKILTGYEAVGQMKKNPSNTIYDAKRFIGKRFTQGQLQHESSRYSFKISLDSHGFARFHVQFKNRPLTVTPEKIGSYIVDTLVENMKRNFSIGTAPKLAVVSVPAEFNQLQRNSTIKALNIAGLKVLRAINEPTAAALAYGLHKRATVSNVLVVDLGGGTLDVSLLSIQGGMFLTMAMAGNNHLGGQDFNNQLYNFLLMDIEKIYGKVVTDSHDLQALNMAVEAAKLNLTSHFSTNINVKLSSISDSSYQRLLTRKDFEVVNKDLFNKVMEPIYAVLNYTELKKEDVDEIVMVGGSTRIPRIRELIGNFFNKKLNVEVDADLAVVSGVAVQAGIIGGMWPLTVSAIEVPTTVKKIIMT